MSRPFIFVGCSMFISLYLYSYLSVNAVVAVFVICLFVSLTAFLLRNKHHFFKAVVLCALSVVVSSSIFMTKTVNEYFPALNICTNEKSVVSGVMIKYDNSYGNHYYTLKNVSVNEKETKNKIRITSKNYYAAEIDDILTFPVTSVNIIGKNDVLLRYKADGIYLRAYCKEFVEVESADKHSVLYYLDSFKQSVGATLDKNLNDDYSDAVKAMVIGDTDGLDENIKRNFRFSGIAHLFAVSGFHLSLWTSAVYFVFEKIFRLKNRFVFIVPIIFVLFFMALTGFTQSVVRAGIMQIIFLSGKLVRYRSDSLNSLFLALSVILFINPFSVVSISLHMSFLATLGIITCSDAVVEPIKKLKSKIKSKFLFKTVSSLYTTVAISVIATLFTLPVSVSNFEYYSAAAPLTNILCMPFAELVMPLSCIGIVFSGISVISAPVNSICNIIMKYIFFVTEKISDLSWAVVDAKSFAIKISIAFLTALIILPVIIFFEKPKKLIKSLCVCILYFLILTVTAETIAFYSHGITVAPVGNGISVLYQTNNKNIIIGCGGNKYKNYYATDMANSVTTEKFDLILIPGVSDYDSLYAAEILRSYDFEKCVFSDDGYLQNIYGLFPDNTVKTSNSNIIIDESFDIVYINDEQFSGARITGNKFSCTVLFCPVADFSQVPEEWLYGDLLITRQNLPEADISGFGTVFVSTDSETPFDKENIYCTSNKGSLFYRVTPWGGKQIYADF